MSPHTWQLVLVAVLAFAAGLVFREIVWLVTWSRRKRPPGASFGATGDVHPGEAVVFDWSDPRGRAEPNVFAVSTGSVGFGQVPAGQTRHLAAVPDERRTHLP